MLYLVMDIIVQWGVFRYLHEEINANRLIVLFAIVLDIVVLTGLLLLKLETDALIVAVAGVLIILIYITEQVFLKQSYETTHSDHSEHR